MNVKWDSIPWALMAGDSFSKKIIFPADYILPPCTMRMVLKNLQGIEVFELSSGQGITITENPVTISIISNNAFFSQKGSYSWKIKLDFGDGVVKTWFAGTLLIKE
jgi:hypothetical protein